MSPTEAKEQLHELTAEEILSKDDTQRVKVDVPEWGGFIWIKGLSGAERDQFESASIQGRGRNQTVNLANFRARLIVKCAEDSKGNKLFKQEQVEALGRKSALALQRVFKQAQDLSGLGDDDIEELTKDLGKDQNGDSGTVFPLPLGSQ